jgi:Spy/CpxP family protein refolding chaperone
MKKQLITAGVAIAVATAGVTGLGMASAATQTGSSNNPMSGLVSAISKKFNLKESDVQAVFDANRTEMEAQREATAKTELATLVKDGKITQAQADAITAKRAELQKTRDANRTSMDSKTDTERKAAMDAERTALDKWFSDNGISTDYRYLVFGGGRGHGGPGGPGGGFGDRSNQSGTSSSSSTTTN